MIVKKFSEKKKNVRLLAGSAEFPSVIYRYTDLGVDAFTLKLYVK